MEISAILDVTLRDGALGLNFPFSMTQSINYLKILVNVGVSKAEVGFIAGPGNWDGKLPNSPNFNIDNIMLSTLIKELPPIALYRMLDGSDQRQYNLDTFGQDPGGGIIRVTVSTHTFQTEYPLLERMAQAGLQFSINLKHSGLFEPKLCAFAGREALKIGAKFFYLVDTTGTMTPTDVRKRVDAVKRAAPELNLGFHGHNSMGLAVANSLTAYKSGCSLIDASLGGIGAGGGNTPIEALILLASPASYTPYLKIKEAYSKLGNLISSRPGKQCFWGRVGCCSSMRNQFEKTARKSKYSVETIAWEWRFGSLLSRSKHALIYRRFDDNGTPFVRKMAIAEKDNFKRELLFHKKAIDLRLPIAQLLREGYEKNFPYYDMPYYSGQTLRKKLVKVGYSLPEAERLIDKFLCALNDKWFTHKGCCESFAMDAYVNRPLLRLSPCLPPKKISNSSSIWNFVDTSNKQEVFSLFSEIVTAKSIQVDGIVFPGAQKLVNQIKSNYHPLLTIPSSSVVMIHGDPHFENAICTSNEDFVFIDPGGFIDGGDAAYDLGKIIVSLGLHDPLLEKLIRPFRWRILEVGQISIREFGIFKKKKLGNAHRTLKEAILSTLFPKRFKNLIENDPQLMDRAYFAAGLHLISMAPTLLENYNWIAIAILIEGIRSLAEIMEGTIKSPKGIDIQNDSFYYTKPEVNNI